MLDLRGVTAPITGSDVAVGFDPNDGSENAGRRSTWTTVLQLLGIHIQFAQSASGPWSSSSTNATHMRMATGLTQPANASTRWSAAIPIGMAAGLTFGDISGMIADSQIPASIMRDAEFTAAAVRGLLGLTATEVNDLFTGATISGQVLTFTQNDGTTVPINIPAAQAGTGDGVVQSGDISGTNLVLTLDNGGMVTIDIDELAFDTELAAFQTAMQVQALINNAGHASQAALDALTARVAALEGGMTHSDTRYAALRPMGATPADFTEADFLGAGAETSTTDDIYTPDSNDDMVAGIAVPLSEGTLTAVAEIDINGDVNPFGHTRADFLPNLGDTDVTLSISGEDHYVYCTDAIVRGILLGEIGFRLTQA